MPNVLLVVAILVIAFLSTGWLEWGFIVAASAWLASLLAFGSFSFFAFVFITAALIIWALEYEEGWSATLTLILTLVAVNGFSGVNLWRFTVDQPLTAFGWLAGYFVVGAVWCIVKWYFFVLNKKDAYDKHKMEFLREHDVNGDAVPDALKDEWHRVIYRHENKYLLMPEASNHKATILMWMGHWPFSMLWTLLNDPIKRVFRWIYRQITTVLDRIAKNIYKDVEKDLN